MRPLELADEPDDFDALVRQPGLSYLATLEGKKPDFNRKPFWRNILTEAHEAYGGICAYTCHYIPWDTGADTIEHFKPKSIYPTLAYEWENYRLVCGRMNGRKGKWEDVIDPFQLNVGVFAIDFPSLMLRVDGIAPEPTRSLAVSTIARLGLNDERSIKARQAYVESYCDGSVDFSYLSAKAPFLASEIERQGLIDTLPQIMLE